MSLVWHIVRKDLRRLAAPLACWAVILIARGELGVWAHAVGGMPPDLLFVLKVLGGILNGLDLVVSALLVASLVQEDELVGTDAFWVTRPVGGGRLLAAKLFGAGLFFVLPPLVLSLRWWLACGYGAAQMGLAALSLLEAQGSWVLIMLALAAVTKGISQFLAGLIGLVLAVLALSYFNANLGLLLNLTGPRGADWLWRALWLGCFIVGVAGVIGLQFFTRRRGQALGLLAAVVVGYECGGLALRVWGGPAGPVPSDTPATTGIRILPPSNASMRSREMEYLVQGVPADFTVRAWVEHEWRWKEGDAAYSFSRLSSGSAFNRFEWSALGLKVPNSEAGPRSDLADAGAGAAGRPSGLLARAPYFLSREQVERLEDEPASYRGQMWGSLWKVTQFRELPLQAGAQVRDGAVELRVDHVTWVEGELRLAVMYGALDQSAYARYMPALAARAIEVDFPKFNLVLVNRQRGAAVRLVGMDELGENIFRLGTQELSWPALHARIPREADETDPEAKPRWLEGATLVVLRYEEAGRFGREVKMERFGGSGTGTDAK